MCLEHRETRRICDASRGGNEKTRVKNSERESTQSLLSGPQCEPFMCGIWTSLIINPAALLGVKVHGRSISIAHNLPFWLPGWSRGGEFGIVSRKQEKSAASGVQRGVTGGGGWRRSAPKGRMWIFLSCSRCHPAGNLISKDQFDGKRGKSLPAAI